MQAPVLAITAPLVLKWMTPGSSLQKPWLPVKPGIIGTAVTK
jgi:hypothetical protein